LHKEYVVSLRIVQFVVAQTCCRSTILSWVAYTFSWSSC